MSTILVVDDDRDIVDAIRTLLEREGYRVLEAEHGAEALRAMAEEEVDLVLLDLLMPSMSGWELLEASEADPRLGSIPVIVLSAAPRDVLPSTRVFDVLQKPFEGRALLARIAQCRTRRVSSVEST